MTENFAAEHFDGQRMEKNAKPARREYGSVFPGGSRRDAGAAGFSVAK